MPVEGSGDIRKRLLSHRHSHDRDIDSGQILPADDSNGSLGDCVMNIVAPVHLGARKDKEKDPPPSRCANHN